VAPNSPELNLLERDVWSRKGTINSSQSLRRMSWKSPYRSSGKSLHKNTSTRR